MFDRTPESIEMRTPAILSAAVHVAALVAAIANFNFFNRPPIEPEPVMVDFVAIDKHAAAPTIGNPPPQPREAKVDKETTKAPPPKTADPPPAPEPPKPELAEVKPPPPKPVEQPKPDPPKPPDDVVALKPKEPEPPKVEKQPEPPKPEPPKPEVKKEPPKPAPPKPAPPTKVDLKDTGRYHNDPTFRAAADSAMRAVSNPRCQPWPLSPDKYNAWRTITFNFDPRDY